MNSLPMILRFFSGSVTPASLRRKRSLASTATRFSPSLLAQVLLHFRELVFAQHAVVDEDAGQPLADGAVHQHGRDGGIHAAGKPADRVAFRADRLANIARRSLR